MTAWAERWVPYWTRGQGVFAMSAEEDTGVSSAYRSVSVHAQDDRDNSEHATDDVLAGLQPSSKAG